MCHSKFASALNINFVGHILSASGTTIKEGNKHAEDVAIIIIGMVSVQTNDIKEKSHITDLEEHVSTRMLKNKISNF